MSVPAVRALSSLPDNVQAEVRAGVELVPGVPLNQTTVASILEYLTTRPRRLRTTSACAGA